MNDSQRLALEAAEITIDNLRDIREIVHNRGSVNGYELI